MTDAPDAVRPFAIACPMPVVDPVTSAVVPERSMFMRHLRRRRVAVQYQVEPVTWGSASASTLAVRPSGWNGDYQQHSISPSRAIDLRTRTRSAAGRAFF